jgi:pimeloyl-ACP methyl ester carboxylesterase
MEEGGNAVHCIHQGEGDAILFIHGMPTNRMLWGGIIQELSSHHRCFAVDLPGMGETPFTPYSLGYLDRQAEQIEQLRIQHGVEKWHVVGHDAGSAIAVQYAARFSPRVSCLALMSPAIFPDLKPFYLLNALRKPLVGEVLAPLLHLIFWRIAMRRALAGESNGALLRAFYEPFSGLTGSWQLMRLVRWGKPQDMLGEIPAKLAALLMPTLLFQGSRDVLPASFVERAASLIPHSRVVTLDTGHFIPLDKPKDVAACLQNFFAENRGTTTMDLPTRAINRTALSALTMPTEPLPLSVGL